MGRGDDVLDQPRGGRCPLCGRRLEPPELRYDDDGAAYLDGPGSYWCPVCGWEDEPPVDVAPDEGYL